MRISTTARYLLDPRLIEPDHPPPGTVEAATTPRFPED